MPYVKKGRRSTKKAVTKTARAVVKASKYLMLKSVETKHHAYDPTTPLSHNTFFSYSITQQVPVGNTSISRVGDSILLQSLILSGEWVCSSAILNVKYRVLVGWTRNQIANTSIASAVFGPTDLFYPQAGFFAHRIVNPSIFQPVYDEMIDINSNNTTGNDLKSFYVKIGLKMQKFDYANQGSALGKNRNLSLIIIPYLSGGQIAGTITGSIQMNSVLLFKDP